ncbi:MAG: dephospho-CoA kinase, long form [Actinobacteria bacterium]|nr:dephospho-CoA kinase, long form [Actinomycetota bacterium]
MYLVGLTGGIGSGKSTVARLLDERGAVVIDADRIAREVVEPGTEGLAAVVERFGEDILDPEGRMDRAAVAEIAFSDDQAREDLNAIIHPRVRQRIAERLGEIAADERERNRIVVLDVPLLVEGGGDHGYEAVLVVTAPEEVRVRRLVEDRGMDPGDVRARISSQASDEERLAVATHVIGNAGTMDELERQVDEVYAELRDAAQTAAGGRS